MAKYLHSFVIPVPRKNMKAYLKMAKATAKLWKRHGAIEYVESLADYAPKGKVTSFPRSVKLKTGEAVVLAYASFKSRAHCERAMKKMMKDPQVQTLWEDLPFDGMRMIFGGFKVIVDV